MADKKNDKTAKLFKAYIEKRKILIADTNNASRAGIAKTLNGLGAKTANITLASSYEAAEEALTQKKPEVVVCDYDLGKQCGLNLLQQQREAVPEAKESLFVLVTGNTSQSAVAQAAEEDIDTFILKPYTLETFRNQLVAATIAKIYPNDYRKTIDEGKGLLFGGKPEESVPIFQKAMKLDPKPSLACFYLGQANLMKKMLEDAESHYGQGVGYNKIHYKCLVGLFELLMERKQHTEAYDIVKKISRYFPANPKRLSQVLRLAIITKSYEDIERYYQAFTTIDVRNEELTKFVCAALVVTGKFYLQTNHRSRAGELFNKAGIAATGRTKILKEIILSLLEYDLIKEAVPYLGRFPPDTQGKPDYVTMQYLIEDRQVAATISVEKGRKLIAEGVEDPLIFRTLIKRSVESGLHDAAQDLVDKAKKTWPDLGQMFDMALSTAAAPADKAS